MIKKFLKKLTGGKKYKDRFQKFYHSNKERIQEERKLTYQEKKNKGICVRCKRKALLGIIFCNYHKQKQKQYNFSSRYKPK
ncbi:hypothetical protein HOC13_01030 [Candidatus Woesearchaeota archaeon]|jgi:hypothetical protein|nr:hypothetical protein [Candidatus Woesearchaeota archaeon]